MKEELKNNLTNAIETDLKEYNNTMFNDGSEDSKPVNKMQMLKAIETEVSIHERLEHYDDNRDIQLKRFELEKSKIESEINLNKSRLEIDKSKMEFEKSIRQQELDEKKKQNELDKSKLELEKKRDRRNFILGIVGTVLPSVVTLTAKIMYTVLTRNAQRHDYENYEIESSSGRENRMNLLSK